MSRILCILFVIGLLFGCQPANKAPGNESAPPKNQPHTQRVKQTAPAPKRNENPQATADRMVEIATRDPQVKSATAVTAGRYTIVGINVDPALDRGRVGTIKYSVAEALKEDPQGANALVTADPDLVGRLKELSEDIRNGRPIAGLAEELADIAGRIAPQPSKQVPKREQPPSRMDQQRINQTPNPKQSPSRPSH